MSSSTFISYSHADKAVARAIADQLSELGFTVWIDEGELRAGDSIIERISTAIAEIDYVVALVSEAAVESPWCQKELALAVTGGLAREHVKVLPLRLGDVQMPDSLADVFYRQVDPDDPAGVVESLATDILAHRGEATADRTSSAPPDASPQSKAIERAAMAPESDFADIRLTGIVREGIGRPRNDGTRGSALYSVPFRLSRRPPREWSAHLVATWDRPPQFTTMHRPGVCRVNGDVVTLDGVTIEEVERYHLKTLKLCVGKVNTDYAAHLEQERVREQREREAAEQDNRLIDETVDRLDFG